MSYTLAPPRTLAARHSYKSFENSFLAPVLFTDTNFGLCFLTKWVSEHGFEQYRLKNTLWCGDLADQRRRDDYGIRLSGGFVLKSCMKKQDFFCSREPWSTRFDYVPDFCDAELHRWYQSCSPGRLDFLRIILRFKSWSRILITCCARVLCQFDIPRMIAISSSGADVK